MTQIDSLNQIAWIYWPPGMDHATAILICNFQTPSKDRILSTPCEIAPWRMPQFLTDD